ncbi:GGDEF domain-containing protein [Vibrio cholerae]|uniref:diguanylate cyclase n=1 Tax=Vibrio metoecus TaxID=1481663 RepID=A0A067B8B5_VIBMT|nr:MULTISPECIES: GGDEF domain-containing protein [Vibrio]ELO1826276.1 GGDEF domain-containing protein [Vibrio cholerae]EEX65194.1 GGDEF family protein [Vibrio metoecus]KDO13010.1 diguanylate cyclase [Vibrio metoecus]KQA16560.1 diguanylate cyclase [Vibrio metoecus]KQA24779.1 diguanylate cyclase [Vibrio metoecus]
MTSIFSSTIIANPEILQFIFQSLPEPTFLLNKQGVYLEAWGGTDSERHHNPSYLVGLSQYDVLPAAQAAWFTQVIVESIEQNCAKELEYEVDPTQLPCFQHVPGPTDKQYFSALVIPLPGTEMVLWTIRNISDYKHTVEKLAQHQLELEHLTHMDHLTQVYNRYAMDSLLPQALDIARLDKMSAAILMIDIDCFKEYNDGYGHIQGDEVLRKISQTLRRWKSNLELCFRYGGDEFLIFMTGANVEQCQQRAEELMGMIANLHIPHHSSRVSDHVTITIGIRHCDLIEREMTAEKLVSVADKALFHAKHQQRGTIHMFSSTTWHE